MSQKVRENWNAWWLQLLTPSDIKSKVGTQTHSLTQRTSIRRPDCKVGAQKVNDICACDPQCARYGDCCRSSPYFVPEEQRLGASPFTCTTLSISNQYVMATCPPDWKDSDTRNRCEHPDSSYRDPLLDAPLTSLSTNTTYQNWHCAYCHGDLDAATTVIWNASFSCYGSDPPTALSDETMAQHLLFNPITSQWILNINLPTSDMKSSKSTSGYIQRSTDNNMQETHYLCHLTFTFPAMELPIRRCNPYEISRCSDSWENTEVKAQCEGYTARVCFGRFKYRNRHCLLCNNVDVPQPCINLSGFPGTNIAPFSVLLDWRRLKRGECASSEIYDPLSCVCRKVFTWTFPKMMCKNFPSSLRTART